MNDLSITGLLEQHSRGKTGALDEAFSIVYEELRKLAHYRLGFRHGNTLDTTALVHEVYLKLAAADRPSVESRGHFLALSSRAMRQIIVDFARSRSSNKRGGDVHKVSLDDTQVPVDDQAEWITAVDQALTQIREIDERLEKVFECRYFAGLSEEESALALGVSVSTVQRDWRRVKAWLRESLSPNDQS